MQFSCTFNQRSCNASFFEFIFNPTYFGCYRFNSHGDLTVKQEGDATGLSVEMYAGLPNSVNSYYRGFNVFVLNASSYPFGNFPPAPIRVTPGIGVRILSSRFFNNKYPFPYSECKVLEDNSVVVRLDDSSLFELATATNFTYTQNTCIRFCFQRMIAVDQRVRGS